MVKSPNLRFFAKRPWRRWLEALRQCDEAMGYDEVTILERRIRHLELQVAELRSKVG